MQILTEIEARVLGSLVEKDVTTPDYYPLSLNALVNACNQKKIRIPGWTLAEAAAPDALKPLQRKAPAGPAAGADTRAPRTDNRAAGELNFPRGETAGLWVF